jgi:two-component system OmpR family response regulator
MEILDIKILAVDQDRIMHETQSAEWLQYGIGSVRVDSMCEAISRLSNKEPFLFIAINEDAVPDFLTYLKLMRDITNIPILVITSNYTLEKKIKVLNYGADGYEMFSDYVKVNVLSALELIGVQKRWTKLSDTTETGIIVCGDIMLFPFHRVTFVDGKELILGRKEFDVLNCLMVHRGKVVKHGTLLEMVWGSANYEIDVLWRTADRLRKKLAQLSPTVYMEAVPNVGYRFVQ